MPLMNSFYGGRRGASFVIVKNYVDVLSMTKDFSLGNDFTEVKFDEYVLINNPYKNHPDNGKIFRRGYDYGSDRTLSAITILIDGNGNYYQNNLQEKYQNLETTDKMVSIEEYMESYNQDTDFIGIKAYGAEYIGSIMGPAGKAPLLSIVPYQVAEEKSSNFEERKVRGSFNPTSDIYEVYNPIEESWSENENTNGIGLIPGKYQGQNNEVNYNDSIQWFCTSIRNDKYGEDTQAFIGFKFPYLVTQMQTSWVEPYAPEDNYKGQVINQGDYADTSEIHKKILTTENGVVKEIFDYQLGDQEEILHPYYNKWHLKIPKGVKGDTLKNFKVTTFNDYQEGSDNSLDKTAIYELYKDSESGEWKEKSLIGGGEVDFQFFKDHYGFTDEDLKENQEYSLQKLLALLENKQILVYEVINYDNKQEGQKKYYYLGDYNQIEGIELDDDGTITVSFTNQDNKVFENKLKWIKDIKLFAGYWENEYQDMEDEEGHLVYLDSEDNQVYYPYPDDTVFKLDENDNPVPAQRVVGRHWRNVTDTSEVTAEDNSVLNQIQNGSLVIHYNQAEEDKVYNIPWVDKIRFNKETGELFYGLTNQDEANILIGNNLHSIDTIIQTDNQLKIVYNHVGENGEKVTQSFPLKSVSKITLLKNPSENTDTEEESTDTEEVNNVFPIFAREAPVQGEIKGKIKYTENHEPIYESFVQNNEGLYQTTDPDDENTKKETLTGIVVFYTDGDHDLITGQRVYDTLIIQDNNQTRGTITEEIGGGFDYLEEFGFETAENSIHGVKNVPNAIYYKTLSDKNTTEVPLTYPVAMYYDQNTGLIKYANSQNQEVDVGNLPIVESIDIGDNLDVYVKMSHSANYFQNIDPSHTNHDQKHRYSEGNYWYKIGNLIQRGLTFAGVRRVFLYSELKEQILALLDSQNKIYSLWDSWQEGLKISADDMVTTLNILYPSGNQQISDNEENSEEITPEEEENVTPEEEQQENENNNENESNSESNNLSQDDNSAFLFIAVKQNVSATSDFYAYSYDMTREIDGIAYGTWFYVGSIGDLGSPDSIFRISEMNSNSAEQDPENPDGTVSNPAILFRTPRDIYKINFTDVILSNPMKEIREGASYKTSIKTSTRLSVGQTIQVRMNDNLIQTFTSSSELPYKVNISEVTGPIEITKRAT